MNGNAHAASPRYIYGDVGVDARMWYQESTETIKSTIDGMTTTHASAADSERVVKYMVIQGHRHQGNSIIDMRIKDINVKVDLNAENPNAQNPEEPVDCNGTCQNLDSEIPKTETTFTDFMNTLNVYWQTINYWPRLFFELVDTLHSAFDILMSTDVLGDNQVHSLSISSPTENDADQNQLQQIAAQMDTGFKELVIRFIVPVSLSVSLKGVLIALEALASPLGLLTSLQTLLAMLGAWVLLFISYAAWMHWSVVNGIVHPYSAAASFLSLVLLLFPSIEAALAAGWIMYRLYRACKPYPTAPAGYVRGFWFVALAVTKIVVMLVCAYYVGWYLSMGWFT